MADDVTPPPPTGPVRGKDEVALELMKFIAVQTGYGKGNLATGFGTAGGKGAKTAEEYAEALLDLYTRCKKVVES